MENSEFEYEYSIEPLSKSELAIQQKCSVETIRLRFKEIKMLVLCKPKKNKKGFTFL